MVIRRAKGKRMAQNIRIKLSGLTCEHCVQHVTEELSALEGVTSVDVHLEVSGVSTVHIASEKQLTDEALREAVDEAGAYSVVEIAR